jgi:hydroxyethylthiazole kinase-like uncharacterized protein yjeF
MNRTLPRWLDPLPNAGEQRELDTWAIEQLGIPGTTLMEHAGARLAAVVAERVPHGQIAVVCGKGNNGGDGLVAARILRERGREVLVLLLGEPGDFPGDASTHLDRLPGAQPQPFEPGKLEQAAGVVDAILGTGFSGEPRDPAAGAIEAINRSGATVIACDVPSGVDVSTGEVAGTAVRAHATVTFHAGKPGLWINPGKTHAGTVTVADIGIPRNREVISPRIGLITDRVLEAIPRRAADSSKFSAGSVLVCGGSRGLTGAPAMAALAAARAGAGYVTVAVPASLVQVFAIKLLEVMQVALPEEGEVLTQSAVGVVLDRAARVQSLVLGPGLGRAPETFNFARDLARRIDIPLVLDADGLNAHAGVHLANLARRPEAAVLTPHAGELGRLLQIDSSEVAARRLALARQAAVTAQAILVLKGDDTIVAEPGGRVGISPGGASALATAGTGDVLSGVTAAHLAKGMEPFDAACAGVHLHAEAGRLAAAEIGPEGVIAGDVIELLPRILARSRDGRARSHG